jgi:hypothetical protein
VIEASIYSVLYPGIEVSFASVFCMHAGVYAASVRSRDTSVYIGMNRRVWIARILRTNRGVI